MRKHNYISLLFELDFWFGIEQTIITRKIVNPMTYSKLKLLSQNLPAVLCGKLFLGQS